MSLNVLTPDEARLADKLASENLGIPSLTLMENAGKRLFQEIVSRFEKKLGRMRVAVFCGKGNNGGDGFVLSRYLKSSVKKLTVYTFGKEEELSPDAAHNYRLIKESGVEIVDASAFLKQYAEFDIYVDAIFGTGFKGKLEKPYLEVVEKINRKPGFKIACDIPSGVNGETGEVAKSAFKAHMTCTFAFLKTGLLLYPGKHFAGEIKVLDIGIPTKKVKADKFLIQAEDIASLLPKYLGNEHKGICGKVLVIAGSKAYTGAGYFTAEAAVQSGAGLVYLAVPEEIRPIMQAKLNEVIVISYDNLKEFTQILKGDYDIVAFGPGLGRTPHTVNMLKEVFKVPQPKVIDADGIWALSKIEEPNLDGSIMTPHPGEASFLVPGVSPGVIDSGRIEYVKKIAEKHHSIAVLKGAPTVISNGRDVYINSTGNPGMAVGGMGDVLTGIIAGLLPRIKDPLQSALAGVYLHGLAADLLLEDNTFETLTPTKVLIGLSKAFLALRRCK
ncbi:MAG TPA: NAD(P)H-hydrate dehydratase [Candidatus Hydrothermia bacterium]|nr:NAD(P)H-hydrate dehydratase [Candidatus Hydrothermia bacterium]HOL24573.1 NAD(P)H-hydrate dehydratase [Candidatus Hydrothermia bacterium]